MSICFQEVQALRELLTSYSIWIKHLHLRALDNEEKWGLLNIALCYKLTIHLKFNYCHCQSIDLESQSGVTETFLDQR